LSDRIVNELRSLLPQEKIHYGKLDITFYRDDIRRELKIANATNIPFSTENKDIVLIDDVLWTGRTIRAAMDGMLYFGRPEKVELLVLVDRRYSRHLPVAADYVGIEVDSITSQKVVVSWKETDGEDKVVLLSEAK